MKKVMKISLIVIVILISLVLLDTLGARVFKRSPLLSVRENLDGKSYVVRGLLMDIYYCEENTTVTVSYQTKTSKFACPIVDADHTFLAQVLEAHANYILVKPNEDTVERKSADKIRVSLGEDKTQNYQEGATIKITYDGRIHETYPTQIDVLALEIIKE